MKPVTKQIDGKLWKLVRAEVITLVSEKYFRKVGGGLGGMLKGIIIKETLHGIRLK